MAAPLSGPLQKKMAIFSNLDTYVSQTVRFMSTFSWSLITILTDTKKKAWYLDTFIDAKFQC